MQCGEGSFLLCPLRLRSSSGALAPPTVRIYGHLPAGWSYQDSLKPGRRTEAPPNAAISTRRAASPKRRQNTNCGYPWGIRLHVSLILFFFNILYLVFI